MQLTTLHSAPAKHSPQGTGTPSAWEEGSSQLLVLAILYAAVIFSAHFSASGVGCMCNFSQSFQIGVKVWFSLVS